MQLTDARSHFKWRKPWEIVDIGVAASKGLSQAYVSPALFAAAETAGNSGGDIAFFFLFFTSWRRASWG